VADVHLPRSLVALFPGAPRRLAARGATVAEVIADLDAQVPGIRNRLLDAGPSIRTRSTRTSATSSPSASRPTVTTSHGMSGHGGEHRGLRPVAAFRRRGVCRTSGRIDGKNAENAC